YRFANGCKAQSCPAITLRREKRLEHLRPHFWGHPAAGVGNRESHIRPRWAVRSPTRAAEFDVRECSANGDGAGLRDGVAGVQYGVQDHAVKLSGISADNRQTRSKIEFERNRPTNEPTENRLERPQCGSDIQRNRLPRTGFANREKLPAYPGDGV